MPAATEKPISQSSPLAASTAGCRATENALLALPPRSDSLVCLRSSRHVRSVLERDPAPAITPVPIPSQPRAIRGRAPWREQLPADFGEFPVSATHAMNRTGLRNDHCERSDAACLRTLPAAAGHECVRGGRRCERLACCADRTSCRCRTDPRPPARPVRLTV